MILTKAEKELKEIEKEKLEYSLKTMTTVFALMLGLIYVLVISKILEFGNNLEMCRALIILIFICSILNFSLSVSLFKNNNNVMKEILIKTFLTLSVMSLIIPIMNYEFKQELDKEGKIQFNKNLQTILDISNENIYENLSSTDKETFMKNINLIKDKFKNVTYPLTGKDLNITENVLYELNVLKQISNSKIQEESINKDTKDLINNINIKGN